MRSVTSSRFIGFARLDSAASDSRFMAISSLMSKVDDLGRGRGRRVEIEPGAHQRRGGMNIAHDQGYRRLRAALRSRAELTFDKETGRLTKVTEVNKVVRGIRPRCQATRLLDPDPVIRAICEQDILVMGVAARAYLLEQRLYWLDQAPAATARLLAA